MNFACDTNVLVDVLSNPSNEEAFSVFLSRFSHVTYLSAVVMLELRADAHPSLVHDALLAASCRESGVTLITRDRDFARFKTVLPGWRFVAPWPEVSQHLGAYYCQRTPTAGKVRVS